MATHFKTLKEYFYPDNGSRTFVVPNYQRGYKWSVRFNKEPTSVEYLMDSLMNAFKTASDRQYFLQGVTVTEDGSNIFLIDGQQRTTTLYLLLWCLDRNNIIGTKEIKLNYSIRSKSRDFINSLKSDPIHIDPNHNDDIQDIFYFKEAILQIQKKIEKDLTEDDRNNFYEFIMHKVSLLYIVIDESKAVRTFTMMNGNKANMHEEELIKAEILHLVSLPEPTKILNEINNMDDISAMAKEMVSIEWETNALRSKYAREWDKWLYWWNRNDVKEFFNTHKPMGLLLEYYYYHKKGDTKNVYSFNNFSNLMSDGDKKTTKVAKDIFKGLRDLQKNFEDIFNNPLSFNYLKCAMIGSDSNADDKFNMIMYFMKYKNNMSLLQRYARWRMIGSSHIETTEEYTKDTTVDGGRYSNKEKRQERVENMRQMLSIPDVYNNNNSKDILFKQLLRLNVKEYNKLNKDKGIKFDFSIWNNKSIEHIYPKSKFYHEQKDEVTGSTKYVNGAGTEITNLDGLLNSDDVFSDKSRYSEHCIGNLVLLYGRDNSEFNALPFEEKKKKFFNNERKFDSRNLLHTISSFANGTWEPKDIENAADKILKLLEDDYKEVDNE